MSHFRNLIHKSKDMPMTHIRTTFELTIARYTSACPGYITLLMARKGDNHQLELDVSYYNCLEETHTSL